MDKNGKFYEAETMGGGVTIADLQSHIKYLNNLLKSVNEESVSWKEKYSILFDKNLNLTSENAALKEREKKLVEWLRYINQNIALPTFLTEPIKQFLATI